MDTPDPVIPDYFWGAGLIGLIIGLVIYLALLALMLWVGYLIIKAAVRNGLREHTLWLEAVAARSAEAPRCPRVRLRRDARALRPVAASAPRSAPRD